MCLMMMMMMLAHTHQRLRSHEASLLPLSTRSWPAPLPCFAASAAIFSTDLSPWSQVQVLLALSPKEEDLLVLLLLDDTGVAKNVGLSCPAMITRIFSSYGPCCCFWFSLVLASPASRSRSPSPFPSRYPESFQ